MNAPQSGRIAIVRRFLAIALLGALASAGMVRTARAAWPDAPIRLVIAFPGGSSEAQARLLSKFMGRYLGQPLVVQAQPGAGGDIACAYVAHAHPDGYTVLLGSNAFFETNPLIYRDTGFRLADLKPVGMLSEQTYVLVVRPKLPVHSVKELIDFAKRHPGKLTNATAGLGSPVALAELEFSSRAGVHFTDVPYKGGGADTLAVLSGFADLEFSGVTDVAGNVDAGKLRALGVTSRTRASRLPGVPTIDQSGLPGYVFTTWNALYVPASTPAPVVARLHDAIVKAVADPKLQAGFTQLGFQPVSSTPEAVTTRIATETEQWRAVFKQRGIVAQ